MCDKGGTKGNIRPHVEVCRTRISCEPGGSLKPIQALCREPSTVWQNEKIRSGAGLSPLLYFRLAPSANPGNYGMTV